MFLSVKEREPCVKHRSLNQLLLVHICRSCCHRCHKEDYVVHILSM